MNVLSVATIYVLGSMLILFLAMSIHTKKLYRMLLYFLAANAMFASILLILNLVIIGGLILLINVGVVVVFLFLTMIIGEVMEE